MVDPPHITEPSQPIKRLRTEPEEAADTVHTKLPSFSSIINGSPKESVVVDDDEAADDDVVQVSVNSSLIPGSNNPESSSLFTTSDSSNVVSTRFEPSFTESSHTLSTNSSINSVLRLQDSRASSVLRMQESLGDRELTVGSAPVSPRVNSSFTRRCSLDNSSVRADSEQLLIGLASKLQSSPLLDILNPAAPDTLPLNNYPLDQEQVSSTDIIKKATTNAIVTTFQEYLITKPSSSSEYQTSSWQSTFVPTTQDRTTSNSDSFTKSSFDQSSDYESVKSGIMKAKTPVHVSPSLGAGGSSTHVTFSDELSHPIPSVSPAKDLKRQNPTPPSESQSSSIFSDLETVLSEAAASDFSFHPDLESQEQGRVKTPEKQLLASVPPEAILEKNTPASATISFNNILDIDKATSNTSEKDNL